MAYTRVTEEVTREISARFKTLPQAVRLSLTLE